MNTRVRIGVGLALLLVTAFAVAPLGRTLTGAKGFKKTYKNRAFFEWRTINLKGRDLPGFDCHVEVLDGDAKMDSLGNGVETDLAVCMITDGAKKIRLGPRDKIVLRDPLEDDARLATTADSCDCDADLEPGSQAWTEGPDDPTIDWPTPRLGFPGWSVWPDTALIAPLPQWLYVVDTEEASGVTRITNHALAQGVIFVEELGPPFTLIPVGPGESVRIMADGTVGPPGNVMVFPLEDIFAPPGQLAEVGFEVWNLSLDPVFFEFFADDSDGWGAAPTPPSALVPPMSFEVVVVSTIVPSIVAMDESASPFRVQPGPTGGNMLTLEARDAGDPTQTHWGGAFVTPDTTATAVRTQTAAHVWLGQCQPNPFNPTTWIPYRVPSRADVRIDVFDTRGRHVATLVDDVMTPGDHATVWNGTNQHGQSVATGVYFYRLTIRGHGSAVRKMALIK